MHRAWISLCVCVSLAAACKRNDTTGPTPPATNDIAYTIVAASDGVGVGGSVVCLPFEDCPNGSAYPFIIKRRLQSEGRVVTVANRAVPGAVLSPAILQLARDIGLGVTDVPGNYLEQIAPFVPTSTTHVTIFAGGNDANVIARNVRAGRGGADPRAFIEAQVQQFGTDLVELVARLRTRAPGLTRIVALNLPNLAAAPYVFALSTADRSILQRIAVGLSDRINALAGQGVTVVDLMCESRLYDPGNFSADGFHPNDRGYQLLADLAYPAFVNGTSPTPSSTCGPRTALPAF